MAEIRREYNLRSEKIIFYNKKVILASLNMNSGVKHRKSMNRSLIKDELYDVHISKNKIANILKFDILNSTMPLIMCTKFQINQIILRLFSGG